MTTNGPIPSKKAIVFEETYHSYLSQLANINLSNRAKRLGVGFSEDTLTIPLYNKPYRVSIKSVFDIKRKKRASFAVAVLLCRYILQCPESKPNEGDWVTYREFKDSGPLVSYFTTNTHKIIETNFSGQLDKLSMVCIKHGAIPIENEPGFDFSAKFNLLPNIPVFLRFNDRDDTFPASASILFRESAEIYLDMECLAIGGTLLTGLLLEKI